MVPPMAMNDGPTSRPRGYSIITLILMVLFGAVLRPISLITNATGSGINVLSIEAG